MPISPGDSNQLFHLIEIDDNGIGFEPHQADRIFQVFQRLHNRSTYAGTGIGLAIVKKVVENHNGFIQAVGRPGEGATFRLLLPASGG
jgi:signal transduction histidine kinase